MAAQSKPPAKTSRISGFWVIVHIVRSALNWIIAPLALALLIIELSTPTLSYNANSDTVTYRDDQPAQDVVVTGFNGQSWPALRTTLVTHDYRNLKIDYVVPDNLGNSPLPLTVVVAGFLTPDWLIDRVIPHGHNVVAIYRSPRSERMLGPYLPYAGSLSNASKMADYWNILATNPFNKLYNVHAGLHEAPDDVVDIITWARSKLGVDIGRINIIGLGSGGLIASAAAHKLQTIGMPVRTLTLVYPPANLQSAVKDNLIGLPRWMRGPVASVLNLVYFRLQLSRHLPTLVYGQKLLVLPRNSYDLATYAADPAISMAGPDSTVKYLDVDYAGYYDAQVSEHVRALVNNWLIQQHAINTY